MGPARVSSPQVDLTPLWPGQDPYSLYSVVPGYSPPPMRERNPPWSAPVPSEEGLRGQRLVVISLPVR